MKLSYLLRVIIGTAALLLAGLSLSGCSTYSQVIGKVESNLAAGEPKLALATLEKAEVADADKTLYLLDMAMLRRLSGDYQGSNAAFEKAKARIEALSATSVSETTGSFVLNDGVRSYLGEPFEQALLHSYAALNYLELGDLQEARVEALQVDQRLKALAMDGENSLAQDAFARYLAGLIYEERGELSDALISYRKAWEIYRAQGKHYAVKVPSFLEQDLLRLTAELGIKDEHKRLMKTFGRDSWPAASDYQQNGELIFLLHNGLAPKKEERISVIYPPRAARIVSIALPHYKVRHSNVARARFQLGDRTASTETVENINAIAIETLDAQMPGITARAVLRAVAKYNLSDRAGKENALAGLAANIAGLLTEHADTRSWNTLPGEIQMARILAPPGQYRMRVELLSAQGQPLEEREFDVTLEKGKKEFLSYHWIPPK